VHGGLSPTITTIDQIRTIDRKQEVGRALSLPHHYHAIATSLPRHAMAYHVTTRHATSCHVIATSHHITPRHARHLTSCHVMPPHATR